MNTFLIFHNFLASCLSLRIHLTTDAIPRMRVSHASVENFDNSESGNYRQSVGEKLSTAMNNNSNSPVKHEIALINGVATRIASARSTEENLCIVVIPGNPGGIGFYDIFISTIFQAGKGKYSVYGVSHAGMAFNTI